MLFNRKITQKDFLWVILSEVLVGMDPTGPTLATEKIPCYQPCEYLQIVFFHKVNLNH